MSQRFKDFLVNEVVSPTIEGFSFTKLGLILSEGDTIYNNIKTVNVQVLYGNPDVPTHYVASSEVLTNVPIYSNYNGAKTTNPNESDIVILGYINADDNAPYVIDVIRRGNAEPGTGKSTGTVDGVEKVNSTVSESNMQVGSMSKNYSDYQAVIDDLWGKIFSEKESKYPWFKAYIIPAHGDWDSGETLEGFLPEKSINLIVALKLKQLLVAQGIPKDNIKLSRDYDSIYPDVGSLRNAIASFNPDYTIWLQASAREDVLYSVVGGAVCGNSAEVEQSTDVAANITNKLKDILGNNPDYNEEDPTSAFDSAIGDLITQLANNKTKAKILEIVYPKIGNDTKTKIDTLGELYNISRAIGNGLCGVWGVPEIPNISMSGTPLAVGTIVEITGQIIFGNEGGYGTVAKADGKDPPALSIGKIQWHAERAHDLMRSIQNNDNHASDNLLPQNILNELLQNRSIWHDRVLNQSEADAISQFISTEAGKQTQDDQATMDIQGYLEAGRTKGIVDNKALVYFADLYNQLPVGANRILKACQGGANATLERIHKAAMADSGMGIYVTRRVRTYNACIAANV